ncbi:flagellar hook-length control protein FliK [Tropicibacter sp. R16_0]|uniref:flagellar hook-length control protein FliK n=1 Tax=Tropicibacter sp. R16_0 TaxID=2821102 RepID=UPI001ADC960C|nr:flagellar hook-length control protein FliK [Tropicibacter sp. R16_0]MBO9450557.1 flagellar hook-length control protein FliK [Tropicibacter sp. R16_0]
MSLLSLSEAVAPAVASITKGGDKAGPKTTELSFDEVIGKIAPPSSKQHSRGESSGLDQTVDKDAEGSSAQASESDTPIEKQPNNDLTDAAHEATPSSPDVPVDKQLPRQARDIVEYALASNLRPEHRAPTHDVPKSVNAPREMAQISETDETHLEDGKPIDLRQEGRAPIQTPRFGFSGEKTPANSVDLHQAKIKPVASTELGRVSNDAPMPADEARHMGPSSTKSSAVEPFAKEIAALASDSPQVRPPAPNTQGLDVAAKNATAAPVAWRQTKPVPAQTPTIEATGKEENAASNVAQKTKADPIQAPVTGTTGQVADATQIAPPQSRTRPDQMSAIGHIVSQATTLSTQSDLVSAQTTQITNTAKVETRVDENAPRTLSVQTNDGGPAVHKINSVPGVNPAATGKENESQYARLVSANTIPENTVSYEPVKRADRSEVTTASHSSAPVGQPIAAVVRQETLAEKPAASVQTAKLNIENVRVVPEPVRSEGTPVGQLETPFVAAAKDQFVKRSPILPQVNAPSPMAVGLPQDDSVLEGTYLTADETVSVSNSISTEDAAAAASAPTAVSGAISGPSKPGLAQTVGAQLAEQLAKRHQGTIGITLNPEELGRVQMAVNASESVVAISITAERPETLDLMRRHVDQLIEEFRQLGYEGVDLAFSGGGSTHDDPQNAPSSNAISATSDTMDSATDPIEENPNRPGQPAGVDMRL